MNAPTNDRDAALATRLLHLAPARDARRRARATSPAPTRVAAPVPAFLRTPGPEARLAAAQAECQALRARLAGVAGVLPALDVARKNARQALTAGPVSLDERARVADLLDQACADLHTALRSPAPDDSKPPEAA